MFCKNCGNELKPNDKFCPNCGTTNDAYVETPSAPVEENTFMQTQPFSIDEVAQKVEENNEAVVTPEVTPVAPVVETPIEPVVTPTVEAPVEEPTTPAIETPVAPVEPTIAPAPVIAPVESANIAAAPKKKGGNTAFIIILIILIVIILAIAGVIMYKLFGGKSSDTPVVNKKDNPVVEPTKKTEPTEPTKKTEPTEPTKKTDTTNKYTLNGYTFTIPDGYKKDEISGIDFIGDSNFWFGNINLTKTYPYSTYKNQMNELFEQLKERFASEGATYLTGSEKSYNGKYYIIASFMLQGTYVDMALTELKDGTVFTAYVYYNKLSDATDGYKKLGQFVDSGTASSDTSFNADLSDDSKATMKSGTGVKIGK